MSMNESFAFGPRCEHPREGGTTGPWTGFPTTGAPTLSRVGSQSGMTLTSTSMRWSPPPKITPRNGTTSAKSAPQVSVM